MSVVLFTCFYLTQEVVRSPRRAAHPAAQRRTNQVPFLPHLLLIYVLIASLLASLAPLPSVSGTVGAAVQPTIQRVGIASL